MIDKRNISFTKFLKGALLGPLAILPASFILYVALSLPSASLSQFLHRINSLFAIAFWGIVVAYALTFSYGMMLWLLLLKIRKHNLIWFLTGSLLPSLLLFIYFKSAGFSILFGYYSLAVSFSCWYLAIRNEFKR